MVSIDIPKNYTASPSSFSGTPHLTINREATVDLDSSNAFEGPEKLLEVWFSESSASLPASSAPAGLKAVPAQVWDEMLDIVNCKVLSVVTSERVDAYLLSESSMFVFPHKIILKTCGTTTLLTGLPRILEIAALIAGFPHTVANQVADTGTAAHPYRVFYSRKNFLFPDLQRGPHRSWRDEVKSLDKLFLGGSAYMIGKMNGEHWYLYLTEPNTTLTPPMTPDHRETETKILNLPTSKTPISVCNDESDDEDETLEILMTDLEKENARQFYLDHASAVAEGQFYRRVEEYGACGDAKTHRPVLDKARTKIVNAANIGCLMTIDENDVFSNTSSDPNDIACFDDDEPLTCPEELTTEGHALGTVVSESSGLADVYPASTYPDARIDAYLFTPCGFSANGVIPAPTGSQSTHYFTVHVTPEPNCSYASFETNVPSWQTGRKTAQVVEQVVNIFRPGRFSVTVFEGKQKDSDCDSDGDDDVDDHDNDGRSRFDPANLTLPTTHSTHQVSHKAHTRERQIARKTSRLDKIGGYRRVDRIVHDLDGYDLVFKYYERFDWQGGAPRLGDSCF